MADKRILDDRYWEWKSQVLKRDSHKCQYPGCRKRKGLQVHHIIRWADCYDLRYSVRNGISICKLHHKRVTGNESIYIDLFLSIIANKK